jgi:hypothetical protein
MSNGSAMYIRGRYIKNDQRKHKINKETKLFEAIQKFHKHHNGFCFFIQLIWIQVNGEYAPDVSCGTCRNQLEGWLRESPGFQPKCERI